MTEEPAVLLELRRLAGQQRETDKAIDRLIAAARARGCTWRLLGRAMGITPDGVRMRVRRREALQETRRAAGIDHEEAM